MGQDEKYLASYMIDAWRRRRDDDLSASINHDPICESPEVTIEFGQASSRFAFGLTPFNSEHGSALVSNKSELVKASYEHMLCPMTDIYDKRSDLSHEDIRDEILQNIRGKGHPFQFPIVLKPSHGSLSRNVHIAKDEEHLLRAIKSIRSEYGQGDQMLVQQFIGDEQGLFREVRGICLDGECLVAYERKTDEVIPEDKIAVPYAWPGVYREQIEDPEIIEQIEKLAEHLYYQHGVSYVAFDMKCDRFGRMWLLEGNISPMELADIEHDLPNGRAIIQDMTDRMIDKIKFQGSAETPDIHVDDLQDGQVGAGAGASHDAPTHD